MPGSNRAYAPVVLLLVVVTGAVLAAPVPVLALAGSDREIVVRLDDGAPLTYSYRQSIYGVPVYEELARTGGRLTLLRVRSPDIRSIEYFRWDGRIDTDATGLWTETAPPNQQAELLIRVTSDGEQVVTVPGRHVPLLAAFGEAVVRVQPRELPLAAVLMGAAR